MGALQAPAAERIAAGARDPERHPDRRAHLGAGRGERLVPPAPDVRVARLLDEPPQGEEIRRALPPPSSAAGARIGAQGRVALPRARLGRDRRCAYVYEAPGETHT